MSIPNSRLKEWLSCSRNWNRLIGFNARCLYMPNRVEELEAQLKELRAEMNGLLNELTDTKTRVRDLEQQLLEEQETEDETQPKLNSDTGQIEPTDVDEEKDVNNDDPDVDDEFIVA